MRKAILFATILFTVCTTTQSVLAQSFNSKFDISFKVPKETQVHKVKGAQVVVNHEEQYSLFEDFKTQVKKKRVLKFDGKSVGNTIKLEELKKGTKLDDFKIKSSTSSEYIILRGATIKSIKKKGNRLLSEIEYLSAN